MVFRDVLQFLFVSLEQIAASLAKVGREYFLNFHDVITDVHLEADIELLERQKVFCFDDIVFLTRLGEPAPPQERHSSTISEA